MALEVSGSSNQKEKTSLNKKIADNLKRQSEIDLFIKRLYEDNVLGKITENRFITLSRGYEDELSVLKADYLEAMKKLDKLENSEQDKKKFLETLRSTTQPKELTSKLLNLLIDKIIVYDIPGEEKPRLQFVFNHVGILRFDLLENE